MASAVATEAFCAFLRSRADGSSDGSSSGVDALHEAIRGGGLGPTLELLFARIVAHVLAEGSASGSSGVGEEAGEEEDGGVYVDSADAFEIFVTTGGNVAMYEAVDRALSAAWQGNGSGSGSAEWSLLDVGTGGGLGLCPALSRTVADPTASLPTVLELVEPAAPMLATALEQVEPLLLEGSAEAELRVHNLSLQEFSTREAAQGCRWEICQATFSLQSLTPPERRAGLRWLAERCSRLLLVEFDVLSTVQAPETAAARELGRAPGVNRTDLLDLVRIGTILDAYTKGVAEYEPLGEDGMRVLDGFMVPVLLGFFDPETATNFEQPASSWVEDLKEAGFDREVSVSTVFEYWWADCVLIDARSSVLAAGSAGPKL